MYPMKSWISRSSQLSGPGRASGETRAQPLPREDALPLELEHIGAPVELGRHARRVPERRGGEVRELAQHLVERSHPGSLPASRIGHPAASDQRPYCVSPGDKPPPHARTPHAPGVRTLDGERQAPLAAASGKILHLHIARRARATGSRPG
jgi:hypothetical protein